MVTYQFEIDDDTWNDWKRTVPRDKSLEQRLIELIEADTHPDNPSNPIETREASTEPADDRRDPQPSEGERRDETASSGTGFGSLEEIVDDVEIPSGYDKQKRAALLEVLRVLRDDGPATKSELQDVVANSEPHGYADANSWWSNVWKGADREGAGDQLRDMGIVELAHKQKGEWRYTGPK